MTLQPALGVSCREQLEPNVKLLEEGPLLEDVVKACDETDVKHLANNLDSLKWSLFGADQARASSEGAAHES